MKTNVAPRMKRRRPSATETLTPSGSPFNDLAAAIGAYLEAVGWRVVAVGHPRILHQEGEREFNYEFVVRFTGGKVSP